MTRGPGGWERRTRWRVPRRVSCKCVCFLLVSRHTSSESVQVLRSHTLTKLVRENYQRGQINLLTLNLRSFQYTCIVTSSFTHTWKRDKEEKDSQ